MVLAQFKSLIHVNLCFSDAYIILIVLYIFVNFLSTQKHVDDEFESENRKTKCLGDMEFLEHQFSELKEL